MSSKTRKSQATSTTGSAKRSVPEHSTAAKVRTDTEDKLWAALHAQPNSTAADLSGAATIGKSTAQKILVKWAGDGSVTRTPGIAEGGRRAADLWAITEVDTARVPNASTDDADTTAQATPEPTEAAAPTEGDDPAEAGSAVAEATEPPKSDGAASTDGSGGEKAERLAPGALRGMVEDYLRDHPGEEVGPTAIAKALGGKSSGAVSNALDKLIEGNTAVKTNDKPRRFALAPEERQPSRKGAKRTR